jgi:hypothetical protein
MTEAITFYDTYSFHTFTFTLRTQAYEWASGVVLDTTPTYRGTQTKGLELLRVCNGVGVWADGPEGECLYAFSDDVPEGATETDPFPTVSKAQQFLDSGDKLLPRDVKWETSTQNELRAYFSDDSSVVPTSCDREWALDVPVSKREPALPPVDDSEIPAHTRRMCEFVSELESMLDDAAALGMPDRCAQLASMCRRLSQAADRRADAVSFRVSGGIQGASVCETDSDQFLDDARKARCPS